MKPIIWCAMDKSTDINLYRECRDIIEPNVSGIYLNDVLTTDAEMVYFALSLPISFCAFWYRDRLKFNQYYAGEVLTYKEKDLWKEYDMENLLRELKDKLFVDEASVRLIEKYKPYECQVSFSNYRRYFVFFEDWFGWRIPIPFTNQIWAWERLQKEFGERFTTCWISLRLNQGDFTKLKKWANEHGKLIAVFVDAGTSEKDFTERWNKFLTN